MFERMGEAIVNSQAVQAVKKKRPGAEMADQFLWRMLQNLDAKCCSHAKS